MYFRVYRSLVLLILCPLHYSKPFRILNVLNCQPMSVHPNQSTEQNKVSLFIIKIFLLTNVHIIDLISVCRQSSQPQQFIDVNVWNCWSDLRWRANKQCDAKCLLPSGTWTRVLVNHAHRPSPIWEGILGRIYDVVVYCSSICINTAKNILISVACTNGHFSEQRLLLEVSAIIIE